MTYPKPLSEKSLHKMYAQSGLSAKKLDILHRLFAACANLYGAIELQDIWAVYQQLNDVPKLRRKDLITFSSIVRREEQPYYVFEIDELYSAEPRKDLRRLLVNRKLIKTGYGKNYFFYTLMNQINLPYYIPDHLLDFAEISPSPQEKKLLEFLSSLVSSNDMCVPRYGNPYPNENKGKRLGEFSFLNHSEKFEAEWLKKRPSALTAFLQECSGSEAEKITRTFLLDIMIGLIPLTRLFEYITDELSEAGAELSFDETKQFMKLLTDVNNHSHLWCRSGWTPIDAFKAFSSNEQPVISFGPGIQKSFQDGTLDKEELIEKLRQMGIQTVD